MEYDVISCFALLFVYFSPKRQSAQRSSLEQFKCSGNFLNTWSVPVFRPCADLSDNFTAIDGCNKRGRKTWSRLMDSLLSYGSVVKISPLRVLRCSHMTIMRDLYKQTCVFAAFLGVGADVDPAASVLAP